MVLFFPADRLACYERNDQYHPGDHLGEAQSAGDQNTVAAKGFQEKARSRSQGNECEE